MPACAGESRAHRVDPVSCSVHARLCGESRAHRVNPVSCSVHPRVYGGKSCAPCRRGVLLGTPPHSRGTQQQRAPHDPARFTPACAGSTTAAFQPASHSVHPRVCGESCISKQSQTLLGPAPLSRGILHQRAIHHPARSTPAACGESQVRSSFHNHFLNRAPCGRSDDKLSLLRAYGGRACRATQALRPLRVTPVRAGPPTQTSATTSQAVQPAVDQTTSSHISEPTGAGHLAPLVPSDIFDAPRTRGDCHHPAPFCDHFRSPCPAVDQTKSSDIPEHTGAWNLAPLVPSVLFDALSHSREIPLSIIVRWSSCGDEATRECSTGLRFALLAPRKHTTRRGRC